MHVADFHSYLRHCDQRRRLAVISISAAVCQTILAVAIPVQLQYTFAYIVPRREVGPLLAAGGLMLALLIAKSAIAFCSRICLLAILKRATTRLRESLLIKLYAVSRAWFHSADRARLHSTLARDTERADVMMGALAAEVLPATLTIVLLTGVLIYLQWLLFLCLLLLYVPAFALVRGVLAPAHRRRIQAYHRSFERFSREVYRVLELMDLTRSRSAEAAEIDRQRQLAGEFQANCEGLAFAETLHKTVHQTVIGAGGVFVLILGGALIANSQIGTGDLAAFYVALVLLRSAVDVWLSRHSQLLEGVAALGQIRALLAVNDLNPYSGSRPIAAPERITFRSVYFGYDRGLLHDINLNIHAGEVIAITGPNGAGKTSLLYLLLGLYRPGFGSLLADDIPYAEIDVAHLRRHLGVILQEPLLFNGTVRENLVYGCPGADEAQVTDAVQLATADEVVRRLPQGLDTVIGEGGVFLSGGQRQRLAIARALIGRPRFLVLDEPTNHLDASAIARVLQNVTSLPEQPAVVLISHDARVVELAQSVYRLEAGRLHRVEVYHAA